MEIKFNDSGVICGAKIINYLLEKSRVVRQTPKERSYHAFYQLCTGASSETRKKYSIGKAEQFSYLNQSSCLSIDGVNDASEFNEVLHSLEKLHFSNQEKESIISILAAVLHLGNLLITAHPTKGSEQSVISNKDQLILVSKILQVKPEVLEDAICFKSVTVRGEVNKINSRPEQAIDSRDSLAKALYGNMFDWLVYKINDFLGSHTSMSTQTVGILDIFGFEIFEKNSLEQFCINFANETLQQHFNDYIFKMEQEEYRLENVPVESIAFVDNSDIIILINSILGNIDEEVMLPKGSDTSLIEKMNITYGGKTRTASPYYVINKTSQNLNFSLKHYAGSVTYSIEKFLDKNRDMVHESLMKCIQSTAEPLMRLIFSDFSFVKANETEVKEISEKSKKEEKKEEKFTKDDARPRTRGSNTNSSASPSPSKKKTQTLGSKFRSQLDSLMETIKSKHPHFIRCIKPNSMKVASIFDSNMVLQQLRYAGLLEAIRIRASGFPYRRVFSSFVHRYKCLTSKEKRKELEALNLEVKRNDEISVEASQKQAQIIINAVNLSGSSSLHVGKTKIFYRNDVLTKLEELRDIQLRKYAVMFESLVRRHFAKLELQKLKKVNRDGQKAITDGDLAALEMVFKYAENERIFDFIPKTMKDCLVYLGEEKRVIELLKKAISQKDTNLLDASLHQAEKIELERKTCKPTALQVLQEAKKCRETIHKARALRGKIQAAIHSESLEGLQVLLEEVKNSGNLLGESDDAVVKAQKLCKQLEEELRLFENLSTLEKRYNDTEIKAEQAQELQKAIIPCERIKSSRLTPSRSEMISVGKRMVIRAFREPLDVSHELILFELILNIYCTASIKGIQRQRNQKSAEIN